MNAEGTSTSKPQLMRWGKRFVGVVILALAVYGMVKIFSGAQRDLDRQSFSLGQIQWAWLVLAGGLYLIGTFLCAVYWHLVLRTLQQRPLFRESLRAYFVGGLGKYVPGKAMVVVLRAAYVKSSRVDAIVAGTSVFIETFTMMAAGGIVATAILDLAFLFPGQGQAIDPWVVLISSVLMLACVVPTLPPVFRRVVKILQVQRMSGAVETTLQGLNLRLIATGWAINSVGWLLLGLSLWATLRALPPNLVPPGAADSHLPLLVAAAALSVLAGFASPLPAGFGVRDFVVMALVGATFGKGAAVVSACLLRVIWLVAELAASSILYLCVPPPRD